MGDVVWHDPKAPLRRKECWLCEVPLEWARKGICHSMFDRSQCFWVPALRDFSPSIALRMSAEALAGEKADG